MSELSLRVIAAHHGLNASKISRVGVGTDRSVRAGKG